MFSRLCKLCHESVDVSAVNLRRYRISSNLLQEHATPKIKVSEKDNRIPLVLCRRPQFNFYKGKTFTKFETITLASQGWHHAKSAGDHFTIIPDYDGEDECESPYQDRQGFDQFRLHPKLIENLLKNHIQTPTEIQTLGIPKILEREHTVLSAETGCGKTIAYLLPILDCILKWKRCPENLKRNPNNPFSLIVTPSRELAEQIWRVAESLAENLGIKIKVLTGGRTKRLMASPSVREIDLLIGSFGVMSKMITTRMYKLNYVRHIVLDEAHALFDVTFDEKLEVFLRRINFDRGLMTDGSDLPIGSQLILVSATKPSSLPEYLSNIIDIESLYDVTTNNFHRVMVPQKFMRITGLDKPMTLLKLVKPKAMKKYPVMIFSNTSTTCDWISLYLNEFGIRTNYLNGEMPMVLRHGRFAAFQKGEYTVLSTTNAGARGLDTVHVKNIINYDLPMETAEYIHRCGRTGRLGTHGECRVTNFISRHLEVDLAQKMERAARRMRPLPIFNMLEEAMKREENKKLKEPVTTQRRRRKSRSQTRTKKTTESAKESSA